MTTNSFADGVTLILVTKLTPAGTMNVSTDPGVTNGRIFMKNDNQLEWLNFSSVTNTGSYFTLG